MRPETGRKGPGLKGVCSAELKVPRPDPHPEHCLPEGDSIFIDTFTKGEPIYIDIHNGMCRRVREANTHYAVQLACVKT